MALTPAERLIVQALIINDLTPFAGADIASILTDTSAITWGDITAIIADIGVFPTANYATLAAYVEDIRTRLIAIVGDTNELQTDWVNGGRLDLLIDAIKAKTDTIVAMRGTDGALLAASYVTERGTDLSELESSALTRYNAIIAAIGAVAGGTTFSRYSYSGSIPGTGYYVPASDKIVYTSLITYAAKLEIYYSSYLIVSKPASDVYGHARTIAHDGTYLKYKNIYGSAKTLKLNGLSYASPPPRLKPAEHDLVLEMDKDGYICIDDRDLTKKMKELLDEESLIDLAEETKRPVTALKEMTWVAFIKSDIADKDVQGYRKYRDEIKKAGYNV